MFNPLTSAVQDRLRCAAQPELCRQATVVAPLPFFTTCSDDSNSNMIRKGLDESYKNHVGFATIRASGEE